MRRRLTPVAAALCAVLLAVTAHAQPTVADRENARSAWTTAMAKRQEGNHVEALKLFETAHALMGLPTTGIEVAREREALGLFLDAHEMAVAVLALPAISPEDQRARADATSLAAGLAPRIASIAVHVKGPPAGTEVRVRIDGQETKDTGASAVYRVNPGRRTVAVTAEGYLPVTQTVQVAEAATERLDVELVPSLPPGALAMVGREVVVMTGDGRAVLGVLVSASDREIVLDHGAGKRTVIDRKEARSMRLPIDLGPNADAGPRWYKPGDLVDAPRPGRAKIGVGIAMVAVGGGALLAGGIATALGAIGQDEGATAAGIGLLVGGPCSMVVGGVLIWSGRRDNKAARADAAGAPFQWPSVQILPPLHVGGRTTTGMLGATWQF